MTGVSTGSFHPDLRRVATFLPREPVRSRSLPLLRCVDAAMRRRKGSGITTESLGEVTCRIHHPPSTESGPFPALLWMHGGGFVMGTAAQDDEVCGFLAASLGIVVAAVDYRLAPEHPFPTPLDDCHDALVWLATRDDVDERRVAVAGASAGGGLAAALALLARDRDEVRAAFQLLAYPMLDDRTTVRDLDDRRVRMWNNRSNRFGWSSYLGAPPGAPNVSGLASPARHDDLSGLPPAWIGVGTLDLFLHEDTEYAARLRDAGVNCTLDVVEGAFHAFDSIRPKADVTARFRAAQRHALAGALRP